MLFERLKTSIRMSEAHFDEFEHYNFDQDKHVNLSGHSGEQLYLLTKTFIFCNIRLI